MIGLELLALLGVGGFVPMAGILMVRRHQQRTWQRELAAYVLRFPRGLDPSAVVAFLEGLSGIVAPRLKRPFVVRAVVFETSATPAGIQHRLIGQCAVALDLHIAQGHISAPMSMPAFIRFHLTPVEPDSRQRPIICREH